nr:MAG TPA: hypothetical protein [Caudoviricetes sp.]
MTTPQSPPGPLPRTPPRSTGVPRTPGFPSCRCRALVTSRASCRCSDRA